MKIIHPKTALRDYRTKNNLKAAEVAKTLEIAESTLRSYENGTREVDGDMAARIERRIGVPRARIRPDLFARQLAA